MKNFGTALKLIKKKSSENSNLIVGIGGGSCAGKTTLAQRLQELFGAAAIKMDDYYRGIGPLDQVFDYNFDEPAAIEMEPLAQHLQELKQGRPVKKPVYNFVTHSRAGYEPFQPAKIILLDGIFALHSSLVKHLDVKLFVDCPEEQMLARRLQRDIAERGRTRESVLHQYEKTVRPMHELHVEPTWRYADVVVLNY